MEKKAEASLLGLVVALEVAVEVEGRGSGGGGGGGGIVMAGESLLWALIAAEDVDDDAESSVSARISVLETLALFLWPHCKSMSPLPAPAPRTGLGLAFAPGLGLLSRLAFCVWVWAWWFFVGCGGESWCWWWFSDWGEVGAASRVLWSWVVLDGDLNLKPLPSKAEQAVPLTFPLVLVLVVLVVGWRIRPLMEDFLPLLKGTPSGLLTL